MHTIRVVHERILNYFIYYENFGTFNAPYSVARYQILLYKNLSKILIQRFIAYFVYLLYKIYK